jgi:hypothetical protein
MSMRPSRAPSKPALLSFARLPTDRFYGDRNGSFRASFGHVWHVTTHIEDVAPSKKSR